MAIDRDGDGPPLRKDDAAKPAEGLRASPFTEDVFDDEYYGRRRRGGGISFGVITGVVFVAAIVAAAGWYIVGERSASTGGEAGAGQIVKADPTPYKVKPDDPGGMQVDNQDKLIYDRVAKGAPPSRVENLLPAAEVPHAPPVQAAPAASGSGIAQNSPAAAPTASTDDSLAKLMAQLSASRGAGSPQNATSSPTAPASAQPPTGNSAAASDKGAPEALAAPATSNAAPAQVAAVAPPAAAPVQASTPPASAPARPMLLVPAADSAVQSPSPSPPASPAAASTASDITVAQAPAAAVPVSAAPPGTGGVSIQLASARSADAALGEWKRISGKNNDLLAGLTPSVVQAEVPDKGTYFRLRAGPLADKPAAESLCGSLAARNVSCIVVRP